MRRSNKLNPKVGCTVEQKSHGLSHFLGGKCHLRMWSWSAKLNSCRLIFKRTYCNLQYPVNPNFQVCLWQVMDKWLCKATQCLDRKYIFICARSKRNILSNCMPLATGEYWSKQSRYAVLATLPLIKNFNRESAPPLHLHLAYVRMATEVNTGHHSGCGVNAKETCPAVSFLQGRRRAGELREHCLLALS